MGVLKPDIIWLLWVLRSLELRFSLLITQCHHKKKLTAKALRLENPVNDFVNIERDVNPLQKIIHMKDKPILAEKWETFIND